jgi:hypothetical protein
MNLFKLSPAVLRFSSGRMSTARLTESACNREDYHSKGCKIGRLARVVSTRRGYGQNSKVGCARGCRIVITLTALNRDIGSLRNIVR